MSGFPGTAAIKSTYEDQVEALKVLFHARTIIASDKHSRFWGLQPAEIQKRLEEDRNEIDRWASLMLVASFEATLRSDAKSRIASRTKDDVRRQLRDLYAAHGDRDRARFDDILMIWESHAAVGTAVKNNLRTLVRHRHWLAHGRHWTNKHGVLRQPLDVYSCLSDYMEALRASVPDFPRA